MYGLKKNVVVKDAAVSRRAAEQGCRIEQLEGRTLLSAAWATTSAISTASYPGLTINKMSASPDGNVYAVGTYSTGSWDRGIALEMVAGSNTWTPILDLGVSTAATQFLAVDADATGNVYIAGRNGATAHQAIWERPKGQSNFVVIDDYAGSHYFDLAVDTAGNVFAVGDARLSTQKFAAAQWIVRKQSNGQGPFTTVDVGAQYTYAKGINIVGSGSNEALYVTGGIVATGGSGHFLVRKSTNGGANWTTVQDFDFDPATPGGCAPTAITSDGAGNLFVVGVGDKGTISGGPKGRPSYTYTNYWLVRKSTDGGVTWSTSDAFADGDYAQTAQAAGFDPTTGTVYVVGDIVEPDASGVLTRHGLVRSNAGGTWATVDDYGRTGVGFASDASGHVYAGIFAPGQGWVMRSPIPAAAPAAATFSTAPIAAATVSPDPTSIMRSSLQTADGAAGVSPFSSGPADLLNEQDAALLN